MSIFLTLLADQRPTRVPSRSGVETREMDGVRELEKRGREGDRMLLLMRVPVREAPEAGSSSHQQEASWAVPRVPQGSPGPAEAPNLPLDCIPARPIPELL